MSYTPEMRESIKKVEATRPARLSEHFPTLKPEEKQRLLEEFHPDYRADSFRAIKVGPNKGEKAMNKLVDILEGCSRVTPDMLDLEQIDYDPTMGGQLGEPLNSGSTPSRWALGASGRTPSARRAPRTLCG
jgi:hypothetical protein